MDFTRTCGRAGLLLALSALPLRAAAQEYRSATWQRRALAEPRLDVQVEFGLGEFRLQPGPAGSLYGVDLIYDENLFRPVHRYRSDSGRLELGVSAVRPSGNVRSPKGTDQRMAVRLAPDIPVTLDLKIGAVKSDVDLGGLTLVEAEVATGATEGRLRASRPNPAGCRQLTIQVGAADFRTESLGNLRCARIELMGGAGDFVLDLSGDWGPVSEAAVKIAVGVSSLTLRLPDGAGVAVSLQRFLASFDESGFERRGGTWFSAGYDQAALHLDLDIQAALGNIDIEWVGPVTAARTR